MAIQNVTPRPRANMWQDWINLALGAWLFFSPWFLDFEMRNDAMAWNAWISGAVVSALSAAALLNNMRWEESLNVIAGIWLFISPWVIGAAAPAVFWNFLVVGAAVFVLAMWDLADSSAGSEVYVPR